MRYQEWNERAWINKLCELEPMEPWREEIYLRRIKAGDQKSRDYFIRANHRLVMKIARWYRHRFPDLDIDDIELFGEGVVGLIEALDRFDISRDTKFSTYATPYIKLHIRKYLEFRGKVFRIPGSYRFRVIKKVRNATKSFLEEKNRSPTFEELASATGLKKIEDVIRAYELSQMPVASDPYHRDSEEEQVEMVSVIPSDDHMLQQYIEIRDSMMHALSQVLDVQELDVICKRYGIGEPEPMILEDVAALYGVSHQRIQQIEKKAIAKLDEAKDKLNLGELLQSMKRINDEFFA